MKMIFSILLIIGASIAHASDPLESNQWYLNSGANVKKAWRVLERNYEPIIAVIDAGFDIEHEDLKAIILINYDEVPDNGIDDDNNGYVDDYYGYNAYKQNGKVTGAHIFAKRHGTAVAGVISAKHSNGIGIKGVTDGFKIIPIVKPDAMAKRPEKLKYLIQAFRYAMVRGADIINFSVRLHVTSVEFKDVMRELNDRGIIVVASAGNRGRFNASNRYPEAYANEFSNIIVVASSDRNGEKVSSSNYGNNTVHLFAPGEDILTTYPDGNPRYDFVKGTSFAAPIVSGVAALVIATHGPESRWTIRDRLMATSRHYEALRGKALSSGVVDAYKAIIGF